MTRKIVSEMTYNVPMGTLNPTIPSRPTYVQIADLNLTLSVKLKLTLTLTDTGGAVLTLMLGYKSLYITWQKHHSG